jgi:UDP-3-O-[3-hydroxymyristoyl] glucosamine N-acyltransferase
MSVDPRFFRIVSGIRVVDLAAHLRATVSVGDTDQVVTGVAPLAVAGRGDVTFQSAGPTADSELAAGVIIITTADIAAQIAEITQLESERTILIVEYPRRSFASALDMIVEAAEPRGCKTYVDQLAQIHPTASVGDGVMIGVGSVVEAGAVIKSGVVIGTNCNIGANSVLSHCHIANHVTIGAGTVIGESGFGFEMTKDGVIHLPHVGIVRIASGCVIGNQCSIDRGSLGDTVLGRSVMIDNMCHIAHNVQIGDRSIVAAQCGISGSVDIGADVQMGGQVGIAPHLKIGDGAVLTARSGVTKDVERNTQMAGFPAIEAGRYWRERAALRRLSKLPSKAGKKDKKELKRNEK